MIYQMVTKMCSHYRCRRVIILMSRSFLKSQCCDFQVKFAQALAPGMSQIGYIITSKQYRHCSPLSNYVVYINYIKRRSYNNNNNSKPIPLYFESTLIWLATLF